MYEALLGTLCADLVFKDGNDWKFGTRTRNVDRNEPHGFRFLFWTDATWRHKDLRRRGKASARAMVAAVDTVFEVFQHIPCFPAEKPDTTQIIMTNTKFQHRACLGLSFPNLSPIHCMLPPAIQGTDDTHALARAKQGKGSGCKRLETVKLSGGTCHRPQ